MYYLIVTLPLIRIVSKVEERLARSESGQGPRPKGPAKASGIEERDAETVPGDLDPDPVAQAVAEESRKAFGSVRLKPQEPAFGWARARMACDPREEA